MTDRLDMIDISRTLKSGMPVWPGDTKVKVSKTRSFRSRDGYELSDIRMSLHAGTHVDAPKHFFRDGLTAEKTDLSALNGPARVIRAGCGAITASALELYKIKKHERLIIRTDSFDASKFNRDHSFLTEKAAGFLASKKILCLGMDTPSPGPFSDPAAVHRILMKAGILIIENLELSKVVPGRYTLVCLPLKIAGAEASPAGAALIRIKVSK